MANRNFFRRLGLAGDGRRFHFGLYALGVRRWSFLGELLGLCCRGWPVAKPWRFGKSGGGGGISTSVRRIMPISVEWRIESTAGSPVVGRHEKKGKFIKEAKQAWTR